MESNTHTVSQYEFEEEYQKHFGKPKEKIDSFLDQLNISFDFKDCLYVILKDQSIKILEDYINNLKIDTNIKIISEQKRNCVMYCTGTFFVKNGVVMSKSCFKMQSIYKKALLRHNCISFILSHSGIKNG